MPLRVSYRWVDFMTMAPAKIRISHPVAFVFGQLLLQREIHQTIPYYPCAEVGINKTWENNSAGQVLLTDGRCNHND